MWGMGIASLATQWLLLARGRSFAQHPFVQVAWIPISNHDFQRLSITLNSHRKTHISFPTIHLIFLAIITRYIYIVEDVVVEFLGPLCLGRKEG